MKCPACSADGPDGAPECAACGVNFAKWQAKLEKKAAEEAAAAQAAAAAPPAPPPAPKSTLGLTVGLMAALCVAVYFAYDVAQRRLEPPADKSGVIVKPDAYRPLITALEASLYKEEPAALADAQAVSDAASRLAGSIMERNQKNPFVRDAVGDLMEFSGAVGTAEEGLQMPPNARLDWIRRWETVRARRFEKAPWFHASVTSADGPAPDFERAAARLQTTAHRLRSLLEALPPELEGFGEDDVTLQALKRDGDKAKERLDAWRLWVAAWQPRVDQALTGFPQPDEIPPELQFQYDTLVRSAQEARNPPNPGPGVFSSGAALTAVYLPGKRSRDTWLANIAGWLGGLDESIAGARAARAEAKKG